MQCTTTYIELTGRLSNGPISDPLHLISPQTVDGKSIPIKFQLEIDENVCRAHLKHIGQLLGDAMTNHTLFAKASNE